MKQKPAIPRPLVVLNFALFAWALVIFAIYGGVSFYKNMTADHKSVIGKQKGFLLVNQLPLVDNAPLEHLLTVADSLTVNTIWFQDLNKNGIYDGEDYLFDMASSGSKIDRTVRYTRKPEDTCKNNLVFAADPPAQLQAVNWFVTKLVGRNTAESKKEKSEKIDELIDVTALM